MERVPEPELMDEPDQARAYSEANFDAPHDRFVTLFGEAFPAVRLGGAAVIDLGCGPADVTVRFARAYPQCRVTGLDAGPNMLALAAARIIAAGLSARVDLVRGRLPSHVLPRQAYDAVISNSLLHHLDDPQALWDAIACCARTHAPIFVMDLLRPADGAELDALVALHARDEPAVLRQDFRNSLMAGYRAEEVEGQLARAGLAGLTVTVVSDRHWIVTGRMPSR